MEKWRGSWHDAVCHAWIWNMQREINQKLPLPLAQFNVASCWVVSSCHTFFIGKPHTVSISELADSQSSFSIFHHPHIHGITCVGLLTFIMCWIYYTRQFFSLCVWGIFSLLFFAQGVHLGGWQPWDPQCDASGWRQVHLLCWKWLGQGQQHGRSAGYRQVPANEKCLIIKTLYALFFLMFYSGELMLLRLMSALAGNHSCLSLSILTKQSRLPNVHGCWIMSLWSGWQDTGGYLVIPQGQRREGIALDQMWWDKGLVFTLFTENW